MVSVNCTYIYKLLGVAGNEMEFHPKFKSAILQLLAFFLFFSVWQIVSNALDDASELSKGIDENN